MAFRDILRSALPRRTRQRLVAPLRRMVEGPGIETYVLRPIPFRADPSPVPRLTLHLPSLSRHEAFGGIATGLDFFLALGSALRESLGAELRILTEEPADPAQSALTGRKGAEGVTLARTGGPGGVPVRRAELFLVYNWWTALNVESLLRAQTAHFGTAPLPKFYLIQEYEPQFYPFSSAHLLAKQAFNSAWPTHAIFNTAELHAYYRMQGDACARAHVFEPRLPGALRGFLDGIAPEEKTRTLLVYGRPQVPRNCFSILKRGLELWAAADPAARDWQVVSAGLPHPDIPLAPGLALRSLGKLPLEEYARLLRRTAVGVALMSSPHPSYPPLEMAHFGILTLSNRYAGKDLSRRHDNIVSLPDPLPETLAAGIAAAVARFAADPGAGLAGGLATRSHMPDYLSPDPFDCLGAVVEEMTALLGPGPGPGPG